MTGGDEWSYDGCDTQTRDNSAGRAGAVLATVRKVNASTPPLLSKRYYGADEFTREREAAFYIPKLPTGPPWPGHLAV
jgi:hypothetical protein